VVTQTGFGGIFVMSSAKTAAQLKKEAKAKRVQAAAIRGVEMCLHLLCLVPLYIVISKFLMTPFAGGAVASKAKVEETDEIAEVVDEATAALKELNASGSVSKSVADTQLAAARNVTGEREHLPWPQERRLDWHFVS
jgi:hypothetical protein